MFSQNEYDSEKKYWRLWMQPISKVDQKYLPTRNNRHIYNHKHAYHRGVLINNEMTTPKSFHDTTTPIENLQLCVFAKYFSTVMFPLLVLVESLIDYNWPVYHSG